jgi:HTH-type transcriptional regulator / antitoxin HigA
MRRVKTSHGPLPDSFEELCRMHLPRTIRDSVDYDNTTEIVNRLAVLEKRSGGQEEYLETLSQLIKAYDNANFQIKATTPLKALRFLMEANGLNASDIGRILGNRPLGSAILRGERQISKENALKLAKRFKVNVGLFIG